MTAATGTLRIAPGALHVVGARHPLQRAARAVALRGAGGALILHAALGLGLALALREGSGPATAPGVGSKEPIVIRFDLAPPPSIGDGLQGPAIPGARPKGRAANVGIGFPDPVADVEATAATIADWREMGLPIGDDGVEGVGTGGSGRGGPASLPSGVIVEAREPEVFEWAEEMPQRVRMPVPEYPPLAREAGIQGRVLVRAIVGPDGRVVRTEIVEGAGILARAAEPAVRQALFTPGLNNGHPVTVSVLVPVTFAIR